MNAIGRLGEIIIKYQEPIMLAVIAIVALAVIVIVVKAVRTAGKNKELLTQINDTVSEINSNVSNIKEKDKDKDPLIYIDNRVADQAVRSGKIQTDAAAKEVHTAEITEEIPVTETTEMQKPPETEISIDSIETSEQEPAFEVTETEAVELTSAPEKTADEQAPATVKKYFSRDCAIDKHGRKYTIEELEKQIKE